MLSGGVAGAHKIQGIGAGFIPKIYDSNVVDSVIRVSDVDTGETARKLAKEEGIHSGISAGATIFASLSLSLFPENKGKKIVAIIPDSGTRYLSTWLYIYENFDKRQIWTTNYARLGIVRWLCSENGQ